MRSQRDLIEHLPRLRRYARALTGDHARADDLVQDTLERALAKLDLWQPESDLRAWLFTLMHNLFVNQLRRHHPAETALEDALDEPVNGGQMEALAARDIHDALARLPAEQRAVLLLVGLEQFGYAEAAQVLGVPTGTVMSRLSRARADAADAGARACHQTESGEMTNAVNEHELHAYVDGALPEARQLEVEAWLASHPEDAARVQAWAGHNRALHATFDGVLNEPLPLDLLRATRRRTAPAAFVAAAAMLAMVISGLVGYAIGTQREQAPVVLARTADLARDAALAHAVFSPEARHPVEVDAAHADHLVAWLSKRVGTPLSVPDFDKQGFRLLGGRLLAGETGPVAQFMYQDGIERRVTLYVRRAVLDGQETAFRHATIDGVDVFYWVDRDFGYALSGEIGRQAMQQLAEAAYHELLRAPARQ